jgi:signal transduction histidine kinase
VGDVNEHRRLRRVERDLHDGVQNELVALIIQLAVAAQDPQTPPGLATALARIEARAQAALDAVRSIARGIYPPLLADFGLAEALRGPAARAAIRVSLIGGVPRSTEEAEEAVYFSCSEAIQNASKHAGLSARMTLWLYHHTRTLTALITDDGRGFDPVQAPEGGGLESIRDRIEGLGGSFAVASEPRRGTVLTISLPWPPRADRRR